MHTAEIETPSKGPLAFLRNRRFMKSEDTMLATIGAWTLGIAILTLTGFYFGTIAGHDNHPHNAPHKDLDPTQLMQAVPYTIGGLVLGIVFALWVTFYYVPNKLREIEHEHADH
jgi:hypothetical protein